MYSSLTGFLPMGLLLLSMEYTSGLILMIVLIVMCFAGMMFASNEDDIAILSVSEAAKAYETVIQKYAKEHGIEDHVLLIKAEVSQ